MRDQFEEALLLQTEFSANNTPAMQRRGQLVRTEIAAEIRALIAGRSGLSEVPDLQVQGKDGTGRKTEVPWVRVYSASRSPSATIGWYAVYLFSAEGDRLYLSINQGTTRWDGAGFPRRPEHELRARVEWARAQLTDDVGEVRGTWLPDIQLDSRRSELGRGYELGNVLALEYHLDAIPSDEELVRDLHEAIHLLGVIYRREDEGLYVPGDPPEVADAETQIERLAGNRRRRAGRGTRLSAAQRRAIELHAVDLATGHLETLGYSVTDVGVTHSFDLLARRGEEELKVEVKGTTSSGSEILLTRNEVLLHQQEHPHNALAIVHSIRLAGNSQEPTAQQGILVFEHPWELDTARLVPMAFRYSTGL